MLGDCEIAIIINPAIIVIKPRDLPSASSLCQPKANITPPTKATTPPIFKSQSQTKVMNPSILVVLLPSANTFVVHTKRLPIKI